MNDKELLENKVVLRPDEVAQILRISKKSVYRLCKNCILIPHQHVPLRITVASVKKYLNIED